MAKNNLQELFRHLDGAVNGNLYMAWYGQCRAFGQSHEMALEDTIEHFGLRDEDWYQRRMARHNEEAQA